MLPPGLQNERRKYVRQQPNFFYETLPCKTCGNCPLETGKTSGKTGENGFKEGLLRSFLELV
jgi:hypothetical protein